MKLMFTMLGFGMIQGLWVTALAGNKRLQEEIVIATKFAAYPWRLTPSQFVNACRYAQLIMKYLDVCSVIMVRFWLWLCFVFWRASLDRIQIEQIGIGQLHWSTANYAPLPPRRLASSPIVKVMPTGLLTLLSSRDGNNSLDIICKKKRG